MAQLDKSIPGQCPLRLKLVFFLGTLLGKSILTYLEGTIETIKKLALSKDYNFSFKLGYIIANGKIKQNKQQQK